MYQLVVVKTTYASDDLTVLGPFASEKDLEQAKEELTHHLPWAEFTFVTVYLGDSK